MDLFCYIRLIWTWNIMIWNYEFVLVPQHIDMFFLRSLLQGQFQTKLGTVDSLGVQIRFGPENKYFAKKNKKTFNYLF